uniref:Putative secreted protein n=1 Tax=Nyssomyia neivai TaxID=330878 RepID=A0A1L8DP56_9DIPT
MKTVFLCFIILCAFIALTQAKCNIPCPLMYRFICAGPPGQARGIRTFPHECELRRHNCKEKTKWIQYKDGEC